MALSNREKQQRWRERHLDQRRTVQRIASLLSRSNWSDEHFEQLGGLLQSMMNRTAIASLRKHLKPTTHEENAAVHKANEDAFRQLWLQEHPGRTAKEYRQQLGDNDSEVWQWRRAKREASTAAEAAAWEVDHPGQKFPEHECSLSDREYTDLNRWRRQQTRRKRRAP